MDTAIDLRIAELLASRLCHDLVSPVGAVNNGLELLEEEPDEDTVADAASLASGSAKQASAMLQFYRLAYGYAGYRIESDGGMLHRLAADYLRSQKTDLLWANPALDAALPEGTGKLLLNVIALGLETLPRGGTIEVLRLSAADGLEVMAEGPRAGFRQECRDALTAEQPDEIEALTPRSVQAYLTALLARRLGGGLAVSAGSEGAERISFAVPRLRHASG